MGRVSFTFVSDFSSGLDGEQHYHRLSQVRAHAARRKHDRHKDVLPKLNSVETNEAGETDVTQAARHDATKTTKSRKKRYDVEGLQHLEVIKRTPSPLEVVSQSLKDPFETVATTKLPTLVQELWQYTWDALIPKNTPALHGKELQKSIIHERRFYTHELLYFHCQVSHVICLCRPFFTDPATFAMLKTLQCFHQNAAIVAINQILTTTRTADVSEAAICAILLLAVQTECPKIFLDPQIYNESPLYKAFLFSTYSCCDGPGPHHDAWIYLVRQRGGLASFETFNPVLANAMCLTTIGCATLSGGRPVFSLPQGAATTAESLLRNIRTTYPTDETSVAAAKALMVDSQLIDLIADMRRLTQALEHHVAVQGTHMGLIGLACMGTALQHSLCSLQYLVEGQIPSVKQTRFPEDEVVNTKNLQTLRNELCRSALRTFTDLTIFPAGIRLAPLDRSRKLLIEVQQIIPTSNREATLVTWSLMLASVAALASEEHKPWFVKRLRQYIIATGLTWQGMKKTVSSILWCDFLIDKPARVAWEAATARQEKHVVKL